MHVRRNGSGRAQARYVPVLVAALMLAVVSGCGIGASIPNPFGSGEPTQTPSAPTQSSSAAKPEQPAPASAAPDSSASTPFWVKNYQLTEMWSGPTNAPDVVSFGTTSQQFCSFEVVLPPDGQRLYVFNPYSQNYLWIDADAVGPVGPPEQRPGPPPPGQNCADAVFTG